MTPPIETPPAETYEQLIERAETLRVAGLTDEQKAAEEAAKAPLTVEAIKLPDGFTADEPTMKSLVDLLNDGAVSPAERLQKLVDLHTAAIQASSEANTKAWTDLQEKWQADFKADPVIGGAKFDQSISTIGKLMTEYGDQELRDWMDSTGAGNSPAMGRFLVKLGAKLTEGPPVSGAPTGSAESAARRIYTTMEQ